MYNVSQQLGACMDPATSPLQTTLPTQRHWLLCRRMQRWQQLQHMGDTQGMLCHKPSLPQPSSCLSMMSTRHIDCACDLTTTAACPTYGGITWTCQCPKALRECLLTWIFREQTMIKYDSLTSNTCPTHYPQCDPAHWEPHDSENTHRNKSFQSVVTATQSIKKQALFTTSLLFFLCLVLLLSLAPTTLLMQKPWRYIWVFMKTIYILYLKFYSVVFSHYSGGISSWKQEQQECYRMSKYEKYKSLFLKT